jgi:hypothetical protein
MKVSGYVRALLASREPLVTPRQQNDMKIEYGKEKQPASLRIKC